MATPALNTIVKMIESLPEPLQEQAVEHLRAYISDLQDAQKWDKAYAKTKSKLTATARRARKEISEGKAEPMDFKRL